MKPDPIPDLPTLFLTSIPDMTHVTVHNAGHFTGMVGKPYAQQSFPADVLASALLRQSRGRSRAFGGNHGGRGVVT